MKTNQLTMEEREKIFYYLSQGRSYREISLLFNRSHTTISREIKRNNINGEYSPFRVERQMMTCRKKRGRRSKIDSNIELFVIVYQKNK